MNELCKIIKDMVFPPIQQYKSKNSQILVIDMEKYTIDIPPFEIPEFDLMSPKEAERFFQWYISNIPKRLITLSEYIETTSKIQIPLDGTNESLINIWKWLTSCKETEVSLKNKSIHKKV